MQSGSFALTSNIPSSSLIKQPHSLSLSIINQTLTLTNQPTKLFPMDDVHPRSDSSLKHAAISSPPPEPPSRYESQKRRDWNTFNQYLQNHCRPPLPLPLCGGAHVVEFLKYLDQFGKTRVHSPVCPFFGQPSPPSPCPCPLKQAWGSLDSIVGRLRAAFEENGGRPENNPFASRAVRMYLKEIRDCQERARGVSYDKKKKKKKLKENPAGDQLVQKHYSD